MYLLCLCKICRSSCIFESVRSHAYDVPEDTITVATEDMVILYLPTLCYSSLVIVMTPMLIPCIARVASQQAILSVTTLFVTGANPTSFVNRQVAVWIESQQSSQALGSCLSCGH